MKLYEEYFGRHNIKLPIIEHCAAGAILLRTSTRRIILNDSTIQTGPWVLLNIVWIENPRGPGSYSVADFSPVRDGYFEKGQIFDRISMSYLMWDKYEDYLLNWIDKLDYWASEYRPIPPDKAFFAAWEMFVYIFDSWFKNQPQTLKNLLFETLDEDNSFDKRKIYYKEICSYMAIHTPAILKIWKEDILNRLSVYSGWLVKLLEEKCQKNTPQSKLLIPY